MNAPSAAHRANRLANEKSPYLLQHQFNPVDWFPWGEEAFAKARREEKPIFLSIGYSTCHWCHVMERESFESEKLAEFLNAHFVSIKVDREERPDVDKIYMTFVQATSGQGGWPLNVFLTPDLRPFFGGTYFPPDNRYGRPSFLQVLQQVQQLWKERREEVVKSAADLHQRLKVYAEQTRSRGGLPDRAVLDRALELFKHEYDSTNGGFGSAPKFPRPSQPLFLLRYGWRVKDQEAVRMVLHTCEQMANGGIYDQLGGGFSRYSVDAKWLVPHFEKMLYDNAQLVALYLDAFLVSGEKRFADVARDILRYILRDMTHPEGGFYSAEDADSEGKEGKFYAWTKAEVEALLTPEEANVAIRFFGITPRGNFVDHSDPNPLPDQNVLSVVDPKLSEAERAFLNSAKKKMWQAREKRVRPHRDDKVLVSWNGMMLGAIARAYAILKDESYRTAAEKNLQFIRAKLWDPASKTLYHRWREGERDQTQLLEAYASLLSGVLDLYEATLEPDQLAFAIELAESMKKRFYDEKEGAFWQSGGSGSDLILRLKDDYDGAEPSGNSVAVVGLARLASITGREEFKAAAEGTLRHFSERLHELPQAVPHLLIGLDFCLEEPKRVAIAGDAKDPAALELIHAAHSIFQPHKIVLGTAGPVEDFTRTLGVQRGRPTAYVCTGRSCLPPATTAADLISKLKQP